MTDHVHNQLCARIEELEKEKMELNEQLDALQGERDALAAWANELVSVVDNRRFGASHIELATWLGHHARKAPTTSLARLKAQWQAEALEHASDRVALAVEADTVRAHLRNQAAKLRRQAAPKPETQP